eukprot:2856425-Pyramimonas_sp.AAC.1
MDRRAPSDEDFHWVLPVLLAYCVADSMFMAIFEKDFLMTMHHIAVIIGVLPLYLAPYGWYMCIVSTFFAEITNPLQNTWAYTREYGPKSCDLDAAFSTLHDACLVSLPPDTLWGVFRLARRKLIW